MKKVITLLAIALAWLTGCNKFDDSKLWDSIGDLDKRVERLEELCEQMNANISSLQTIVQALESHDYIENVVSLPNGDGYVISFASGKDITIYHGEDGKDGEDGSDGADGKDGETPKISVKQDTDGIYYWTVNGEWLLVDGQKIKATGENGNDGSDGADGKDGVTPKFKIENGYWYVSYDNGTRWEQVGKATGENGDSIFEEVTQDDNYVYFHLSDGSIISIPLTQDSKFNISFNTVDIAIVNGGETKSVSYKIDGANDRTIIRTIAQDGWKSIVKPETNSSGHIEITAPSPIVESEVLVFVTNGEKTLMSIINCIQGVINVAEDLYVLSKDGETIGIEISTNLSYTVQISDNAQSWLHVSELQTKAIRNETITLIASPNAGATRYATVELIDDNDKTVETVIVKQSGALGNIADNTDINAESLTVNSSICGDDIAFIRSMPNLKYLNLKDASIVSGGEPYYESNITEDNVIGDNMFSGLSNLETLILPEDVILIGKEAFKDCFALSSLVLGNTITRIDESAFVGCYNLTNLTLPRVDILSGDICDALKNSYVSNVTVSDGTLEIDYAFEGIKTLMQIEIPQSVELMKEDIFKNCASLLNVIFAPESHLKRIGKEAFFRCSSLERIDIPANVETIGGEAFYDCPLLKTIVFAENSKLSIIEDGWINSSSSPDYSSAGKGAFAECSVLESINLPMGLMKIGSYAFARCPKLFEIDLPDSVSEINESAFAESGIKSIIIPENVSLISECLFYECSNLLEVELNDGITKIEGRAFQKTTVQKIDIPGSVTEIGMQAFAHNEELKSVILPERLQILETGVFYRTGLQEIIIPKSVKEIKEQTFEECHSLESVIFEEGSALQKIGGRLSEENPDVDYYIFGAFKRCPLLKSITLPENLRIIDAAAFYDCSSLSRVDASACKYLSAIRKSAFKDCSISEVKMGSDSCPKIEPGTFTVQPNSVLMVLEKNIDTFRMAEGWNEFSNIIAIE